MAKLSDVATTIRSKNAGVSQITFDVIFPDRQTYERVLRAEVLSRERVATLFGLADERISHWVAFEPANAIKFTIYRARPNGSPGDWDVLGCQHYGPLLDVEVPI